ncbi:hypothetical protein N7454_008982 [Penicillium verhagenii]|nr:hypothetical protein N7454_008982 [Penicillium verhagenii]
MPDSVFVCDNYSYVKHPWFCFEDKKLHDAKLFVAFIEAETALRTSVQHEEYIKNSIRASEEGSNELSPISTAELQEKLLKVQETLPICQQSLYEARWALHSDITDSYSSVTKDPSWYLKKGLVNDCLEKGGCCSRECGCCKKRQFSTERNFGIGHCTSYCACCDVARGGALTDESRKYIEESFTRMLQSDTPYFLGRMIWAYFVPPPQVEPKVEEKEVQDKESDTKESDTKEACIKVEAKELDAEDTEAEAQSSRSSKKADSKRSLIWDMFQFRKARIASNV